MAAVAGRSAARSEEDGVIRAGSALPPAVTVNTGAQARGRYHGMLVVTMVSPGCQFAGGYHSSAGMGRCTVSSTVAPSGVMTCMLIAVSAGKGSSASQ